jgi:hypothetical protein
MFFVFVESTSVDYHRPDPFAHTAYFETREEAQRWLREKLREELTTTPPPDHSLEKWMKEIDF